MQLFIKSFKWILLIAGTLTSTMFIGLFNPHYLLTSNFGSVTEGILAEIIVRNWSALIGLMGLLLIYSAFTPPVRRLSLLIVGASKVIFIFLILSLGSEFMAFGIGTAVIIDSILVILFIIYLLLPKRLTGEFNSSAN